jgi:hypothetical protein
VPQWVRNDNRVGRLKLYIELMVEVKGTTSHDPSAILMTGNEVKLHRDNKGHTALAVVSAIKLQKGSTPEASDGNIEISIAWDVDKWTAIPTAFRLEKSLRLEPFSEKM